MKTNAVFEAICAHAVALNQSGRLRNEIFVRGRVVYVVNFDNTIILRFENATLASEDGTEEISFDANDYDSEDFYEEDGKIVFVQKAGGYIRKKMCGKTRRTFAEVDELFNEFSADFSRKKANMVILSENMLTLLEEGLSHIEISSREKKPVLIQRDVYSGAIVELSRESKGLGLTGDRVVSEFGPIGVRTSDFIALFSFNLVLNFYFPGGEGDGWFVVDGNNFNMVALIATCTYDEMGTVGEIGKGDDNGGREEQEDRGSEQEVDPAPDTRTGTQGRGGQLRLLPTQSTKQAPGVGAPVRRRR